MTFNGIKISVRLLGATLALAVCGLLTGNAQAQSRMFVSLDNNSIVSYDISLSTPADVEASKVIFSSTNLNNPSGIAFDSAGNLYAANNSNFDPSNWFNNTYNISKFDPAGNFLTKFGAFDDLVYPQGIAFDSSGNFYASNYFGNKIAKYDSNGNFLTTIGAGGKVRAPYGIAFDKNGRLYVANNNTNDISVFDASGIFQGTIGSYPNMDGPTGIAFDQYGNLYAANGYAITKYDSTGVFVTKIGPSVNLNYPIGIAFDSAGNLYAANYAINTISKFDSTGAFQFSWNTQAAPRFLALGGLGSPSAVPEPSAVAFGIIAIGSVFGLIARKRRW